ncbi:MAG: DUF4920 domain-containing protein [Marinirhabdus sp.]|nr:DUF4920 domain-containing protein [Marinirhabdus sp.]
MKQIILALLAIALFTNCDNKNKENTEVATTDTAEVSQEMAYQHFGEKITDTEVMSQQEMLETYKNLKPGDTVNVKFAAEVNSVCQNKGCWMRVDMGDEEVMVKFKDYGFFMPKDIAGEEVVMRGKAFIDEMSVEDQRHFAEDGGESPEEIAKITEPKRTLSFTADGVLLAEKQ